MQSGTRESYDRTLYRSKYGLGGHLDFLAENTFSKKYGNVMTSNAARR